MFEKIVIGLVLALASIATAVITAIMTARLKKVEDVPKLTYSGLKLLVTNLESDRKRQRRLIRLQQRRIDYAQAKYLEATGSMLKFDDEDDFDELDSWGDD